MNESFDVVSAQQMTAGELASSADEMQTAGENLQARELLELAVKVHPQHGGLWHNLGIMCAHTGDNAEALIAYSQAIDLGYESEVNRGLVYEQVGDFESAEKDYRTALSRNSDDVEALINLGTLSLGSGSLAEATTLLTHAASLDPATNWQLADALVADGDVHGAITALRRAIEAGELRAYLELADLEADHEGKFTVVDHYNHAIIAGASWARRNLAIYLDERGDHGEALTVARAGVEAGDGLCHAPLAVMLEADGDIDGAIAQYRLAVANGDVAYEEDLAHLLEARNDSQGA